MRAARAAERELAALDRDVRTVFAYNLPPSVREREWEERESGHGKARLRLFYSHLLFFPFPPTQADERAVFRFFAPAGRIVDIRIITDRGTTRSKGCAYVEYEDRVSVAAALSLAGGDLGGRSVSVRASEAEKNLAWEAAQRNNPVLAAAAATLTGGGDTAAAVAAAAAAAAGGGLPPPSSSAAALPPTGPSRLYVGGLHASIEEADVRDIFEPFGVVQTTALARDPAGRSSGFGWVTFADPQAAGRALGAMDGVEVAGTKLQVRVAGLPTAGGDSAALPPPPPGAPPLPPPPPSDATTLTSLAAEETGGGLKLTADARATLMARLGGGVATAGAPPPPPPLPDAASHVQLGSVAAALALERGELGPASPVPTRCLLLKNLFDPTAEAGPGWTDVVRDDVGDECARFGTVDHVHVDPASSGFVYVRLADEPSAASARRALHGRWFGGRQVVAEFQFAAAYASHFGLS